ncbi:MAG: bile acid:sodium symporter family protein [Bacteroidetes bacterium]|nr:bile acid:sodium symporter family protein [Bacteroidota bacterium]
MGLIDILVTIVLSLIMFGIGVSLTLSEIKHIFSNPKALIISLFSQMILLPVIAFSIAKLFNMPTYIQIGLVILAASPGGSTSGFITFMFKGNTALSIVLTTVNSILALFTIPLIVNYALHHFEGVDKQFFLPFWNTFGEVFVFTAIPVTAGVLLRQINKNMAQQITKYVKPVLMILLGLVFTLMYFGTGKVSGLATSEALNILPFAILLNVLCLFTGLFIAKLFKLGNKNEITISVESAVHNTTLAFLISGVLLHNENYGKVALVYALFSFWTAILFCFVMKRIHLLKKDN